MDPDEGSSSSSATGGSTPSPAPNKPCRICKGCKSKKACDLLKGSKLDPCLAEGIVNVPGPRLETSLGYGDGGGGGASSTPMPTRTDRQTASAKGKAMVAVRWTDEKKKLLAQCAGLEARLESEQRVHRGTLADLREKHQAELKLLKNQCKASLEGRDQYHRGVTRKLERRIRDLESGEDLLKLRRESEECILQAQQVGKQNVKDERHRSDFRVKEERNKRETEGAKIRTECTALAHALQGAENKVKEAERILEEHSKLSEVAQQTQAELKLSRENLSQTRADHFERGRKAALAAKERFDSQVSSLMEEVYRLEGEIAVLEEGKEKEHMKYMAASKKFSREYDEAVFWKRIAGQFQSKDDTYDPSFPWVKEEDVVDSRYPDGTYPPQTAGDWTRRLAAALVQISGGVIERAQIALRHLLDPTKTSGVAEVLDGMGLSTDMDKVCMMEDAMELIRQAVAILKQQLPETEAWHAYSTISTVMGGLQMHDYSKASIKRMTNLGDAALDGGRERWMGVVEGTGSFYQVNKAAYRNRMDQKYPGIVKFCEDLWKENTQASPMQGDLVFDHRHHAHTKEVGSDGRHQKKCPVNAETKEILCPVETVHFIHGSEDVVYEKAMNGIKEEWIKPDGSMVIKPYFFKACRPWYVRDEGFKTCTCKYCNKMKFCFEDMVKSHLWRESHAACGPSDGAPDEEDDVDVDLTACRSCDQCKSGGCKRAFNSRSSAIKDWSCPAHEEVVDGRAFTLQKWACASGTCDQCGFGTNHAPKRPPLFDCPHIRQVEAVIAAGGEGGGRQQQQENESLKDKLKIPMRKYIKRAQTEEVDDIEREPRWTAAEVGREGESKNKESESEGLEVQYLTIEEAMNYVEEVMREYLLHQHEAKHQSLEFIRCRDKLQPGQIMIIVDFAMNYGHLHQYGLQSDHWGVWQTTILPFVIYRMTRDGRLLLESYIVYSDDLNHSNKFVQHAMTEVIQHYQRTLEVESEDLEQVFIWSDGCAAQFKSRHMMLWYATKARGLSHTKADGTVVRSPRFRHEFFASCHGKNLCDAMAGFIKSWLRRMEERGEAYYRYTTDLHQFFAQHINRKPHATANTKDQQAQVDKALEQATAGEGHMDNYGGQGRRRFSTIVSSFIPRGTVDHVHRVDAPAIPGIQSLHSFMQLSGLENEGKLRMNRLSCYCDGCLGDGDCTARAGRRPVDIEKRLIEKHTQSGDFHGSYPAISQVGWEVVKKASVGDVVGIYVPETNRSGTNEEDGDLWASKKYIIGQLAEEIEPGRNVGTRRRPSAGAKVKVYLPEEVGDQDGSRRYRFPSSVICDDGKSLKDGCACGKKHYTPVSVTLIRGGPWKVDSMTVNEWGDDRNEIMTPRAADEGEEASIDGEGGQAKRPRISRGSSALLQVYARRSGLNQPDPTREQKLLMPLGIYQFLSNLE